MCASVQRYVGMDVGLGDAGHLATLCRDSVAIKPLCEDEQITPFVLHKQYRFGMPDEIRRFVSHAQTL
jgi:hypothetical protein